VEVIESGGEGLWYDMVMKDGAAFRVRLRSMSVQSDADGQKIDVFTSDDPNTPRTVNLADIKSLSPVSESAVK